MINTVKFILIKRGDTMLWTQIQNVLIYNRAPYLFLILFNILGTIYGYIWYQPRLATTPWYFWPFVPDSPTATLFLVVSLILLYFNKKSAVIDALAFVTLIKYGVWAVLMNIILFVHDETIYGMGVLLLLMHAIMAIQAFLFLPLFKFTECSMIVSIIWVFHNDVIDYVFHQYPVYGGLSQYETQIGYMSFWLSVISILFLIYFTRQGKKIDPI